jgi:hypothetical protein
MYFQRQAVPHVHRKKSFSVFPSPAGMSLTKLSLGGNNDVIYKLFSPRESLVSDISRLGTGISKSFFYGVDAKGGIIEKFWREISISHFKFLFLLLKKINFAAGLVVGTVFGNPHRMTNCPFRLFYISKRSISTWPPTYP